MNNKILNFLMYCLLICWFGGCIAGAATDNKKLEDAGGISFVCVIIFASMIPKEEKHDND